MALSAPARYIKRQIGEQSFPIATGQVIYNGAYVCLNTAGYVIVPSDVTTGVDGLGFVVGFDENSQTETNITGDNSIECSVDIGGTIVDGLSVTGVTAQTNVGELVYATSDNVFTLTPTSWIAVVRRVSNTDVSVLFFPYHTMRMIR